MPAVRHVNNKSVSIEHLKTSLFSICMVHLERLSKMTTVGSMNSCYEFYPLFLATKGVALLIAFSSNARVTIKSTICKASVICSGLFVSIFTRWRSWLFMFFFRFYSFPDRLCPTVHCGDRTVQRVTLKTLNSKKWVRVAYFWTSVDVIGIWWYNYCPNCFSNSNHSWRAVSLL